MARPAVGHRPRLREMAMVPLEVGRQEEALQLHHRETEVGRREVGLREASRTSSRASHR